MYSFEHHSIVSVFPIILIISQCRGLKETLENMIVGIIIYK